MGAESQWARNVLAAGTCRLQIGAVVHELDEPRLVSPRRIAGIPSGVGHLMSWLGFRYLTLHRFAARPGTLERPEAARAKGAMGAATPTSGRSASHELRGERPVRDGRPATVAMG